MARTQVRGTSITDGTVQRDDLDITTTGQAVVRKIIAGDRLTIGSTGVDAGTGDVTITGGYAEVEAGTTFPTSPAEGKMFLDTSNENLYIYNQGQWWLLQTLVDSFIQQEDGFFLLQEDGSKLKQES